MADNKLQKRHPGGRPTKYKSEYCEMLKHHMGKEGLSYESFAGIVGVNLDTLYHWETKHPEFSEAKSEAFALNRVWWEKIGAAGMAGKIPGFNATIWIFNMKNRHGWRDRIETKSEVDIRGTFVNINTHIVDLIETIESEPGNDDGSV